MDDKDLEILRLNGEIELLKSEHAEQLKWWAEEQDFWRCKFLKEHPELDNWDYAETAREIEQDNNF